MKYISKKSFRFLVRDSMSSSYFDPKSVSVLHDPAFIVSEIYPFSSKEKKKEFIGVNILDFEKANLNFGNNNSVSDISDNLSKIALKTGASLRLLISSVSDMDITLRLQKSLSAYNSLEIEIFYIDPRKPLSFYFSDMIFMVSHRMHPSIFALSYGIKTLIFPWQHKIMSLYKDLFQENYSNYLLNNCNNNWWKDWLYYFL